MGKSHCERLGRCPGKQSRPQTWSLRPEHVQCIGALDRFPRRLGCQAQWSMDPILGAAARPRALCTQVGCAWQWYLDRGAGDRLTSTTAKQFDPCDSEASFTHNSMMI